MDRLEHLAQDVVETLKTRVRELDRELDRLADLEEPDPMAVASALDERSLLLDEIAMHQRLLTREVG